MNPAVRVLKNSTALTVTIILERSLGFFLPWYVARVLGRDIWGNYSTALAFVLIASSIAPWGMVGLLPREVARDLNKAGNYLANGGLIGGIVSTFVMIVVLVIVQLLNYPEEVSHLINLGVILIIIPSTEVNVIEAVITGLERMEWMVYARLPMTILRIGSSIFLLSRGLGIEILFVLQAIYFVLLCGAYLTIMRHNFTTFQLKTEWMIAKQLFKQGLPFVVIIAAGQVYSHFDRIVLSKSLDSDAVGIYATGIMGVQLMYLITPAIMSSLFPGLSRAFLKSREHFSFLVSQIFKILFVVMYPIMITIIAFATPIILLVFGLEYEPSIIILKVTALGILPSYLSRIMYRSNLASNKENLAIYVSVIGITFNIILLLVLVPNYGLIGASIASVTTILFNLSLNMFLTTRTVSFDFQNSLLRPSACAFSSALVYFGLMRWNEFVAWLLALVIFVFALLITRTVRRSELREMGLYPDQIKLLR